MTVYYILIHAILPLMQWHSRFNCKFIPRLPVDKSIGAKKLGDLKLQYCFFQFLVQICCLGHITLIFKFLSPLTPQKNVHLNAFYFKKEFS